MIKHIKEEDYFKYDVIDLDGVRIAGVQWADDETGFYEVLKFQKNGETIHCPYCNQMIKEIKRGNIKIIEKVKKEGE